MKELDINKKVYDLCMENEGLREFLVENGFTPLGNDAMFRTAGRVTSIASGIENHGLDLDELNSKLENIGMRLVK